MTGLQAARELAGRAARAPLLILSMHDDEQYLFEALKAGRSGYVLKSVADRDLVEACRAAMRGEPFLYPGAVPRSSATTSSAPRRRDAARDPLTPREQQIVEAHRREPHEQEIAEVL